MQRPGSVQVGETVGSVRSDWFTTADRLGEQLIPARADWCCLHVRASVLAALRNGASAPLSEIGVAEPVAGEALEMITLRHRDGHREAVVRQWAADMPLHVGDGYGAGRVTETGLTRYSPHVEPAHLRAAAGTPEELERYRRLNIASSIVVPLRTSAGVLIGAMTLVREPGALPPFTDTDVRAAEQFAEGAAQALDGSRVATVATGSRPTTPRRARTATWRPQRPQDIANCAEGRSWARRVLPEMLTTAPRRDLYDDVDLVVTELISNAVRHGGGLREARLSCTGQHLRVAAADDDPRAPTVRPRRAADQENGRGIHLIEAVADRWGVHRHHTMIGKYVWADVKLAG